MAAGGFFSNPPAADLFPAETVQALLKPAC
jgi:hypothetical protein